MYSPKKVARILGACEALEGLTASLGQVVVTGRLEKARTAGNSRWLVDRNFYLRLNGKNIR